MTNPFIFHNACHKLQIANPNEKHDMPIAIYELTVNAKTSAKIEIIIEVILIISLLVLFILFSFRIFL